MARLDSITFSRISGEVTFSRGEYVKVWFGTDAQGSGRWQSGYITGLRQGGIVVVVDGLEYDRGFIYKTDPPVIPPPKQPRANLSRIVESVNKKHAFEFTEADRVE